MNESEINARLEEIRRDMKVIDGIIFQDFGAGRKSISISKRQADMFGKLLSLFKNMSWQIALDSYKELKCEDSKPIVYSECQKPGTPVKVQPCDKRFEGKTYSGILIGDVATAIHHSIDKEGTLTARLGSYNPAIIIPELGEIVFGYEAWWKETDMEGGRI